MMDASIRAPAILFLGLHIIATLSLSSCRGKLDVICVETEKQALLSFKQGLEDPSNRLSSWDVEHDCCKWAGVVCNNLTGHVHELHLQNPSDDGRLGGELNPSLLKLKHLSYLDLSGNNFGIPIPSFLGALESLEYLNLSEARFSGIIPHQLGNLSNLRSLSLRSDLWLEVENLHWLSGLSSLEFLDLSRVNLSKAPHWLQVINFLPSLILLDLSSCHLDSIPPLPRVNFTSLADLDLSGNDFNSLIPSWILNLNSLVSLDLAASNFEGPIPNGLWNLTSLKVLDLSHNHFNSFPPKCLFGANSLVSPQNMSSLRFLDLSQNSINSSIPNWLYSFRHLEFLDLRGNQLRGTISRSIGNLTSVITLDLSYNELTGGVPREVGNLCKLGYFFLSNNKFGGDISRLFRSLSGCISYTLESLELDWNQFSGHLGDRLGLFKSLRDLFLQHNSISGTLPESFGQLPKLELIDISDNLLEGIVSAVHFSNLTSLRTFYASGNQLVLKVSPNWIPPFQLTGIGLRSWHLGPQFPMWLHSQKSLSWLDLSSTGISDNIPDWFWNQSSSIYYLNLSHNQLQGKIQSIPLIGSSFTSTIYLGSNNFSGPLPSIPSNVYELDLSNNKFSGDIFHFLCGEPKNLRILHIGGNFLSGEIPDCWMNWRQLVVINFRSNRLSGSIPNSLGYLNLLQSLHLRNNSLSGEVPLSLGNCTRLVTIDLAWNQFVGNIPAWFGRSFSNLMILSLRSNRFRGKIPSELCYLTSLQILDLASNSFSGSIPRCFKNFTALTIKLISIDHVSYSLYPGNFLEEALVVTKGREVKYDTILPLVASLDLSFNNISGEIPLGLTSLLALQSLNLSGNHLTGLIPKEISDMDSLESLDFSRNQLSGEIPQSMSALTFLSHLNLSYNMLSGKIPSSTQLQSFDASSFSGNHLCGAPLPEKCRTSTKIPDDGALVEEGKINWFYVSMALGFAVGFWGVVGPLLFNRSWSYGYYQFLDNIWHKLW